MLFASASVSAETAQEGIRNILELYRNKNFTDLVRERYSELHKAKSEAEVKQLIEMFENRYGQEAKLDQMIEILEGAVTGKLEIKHEENPQITETGEVAIFKTEFKGKSIDYKLYEMKTGF